MQVKTVGRDREWFPKWRDLLALEERSVVRPFTIEGGVGDHGGERGTCAAVRSLVCIRSLLKNPQFRDRQIVDRVLPWRACEETTASLMRCSVTCPPRSACRRITRCGRFVPWSTTSCATCRASSMACMPVSVALRFATRASAVASSSPLSLAFHADLRVLAQPRRAILWLTHREGPPPRVAHQRAATPGGHSRVGRRAQRKGQAVQMDQNGRRDSRQDASVCAADSTGACVVTRLLLEITDPRDSKGIWREVDRAAT